MVLIFSFGLLSLHIFKKYAILSLEKAVLAQFWASSLGGAKIRHHGVNPVYLDFSNPLGCRLTENKRENLPLTEQRSGTVWFGLIALHTNTYK